MSNEVYEYDGFKILSETIELYAEKVEEKNIVDILEAGAKEFVNDLLKLPSPMSRIRKSGYTHLIRTFSTRKLKNEVEVGWGKYYGPMVEHGTTKINEKPHVYPLWDKNKEKYYKTMITKLGLQTW